MRPIVVSKVGVVAMEASSRFKCEIAPELGLRDVFKMKLEHLAKKTSGYEMPSQKEIDEYIRAKEEYVATEVLRKCGWTEYVKRCKLVGIENYINEHTPCEGPNGQCNMFCRDYLKGCHP